MYQHLAHCQKNAHTKLPVVVSRGRYNRILAHATNATKVQQEKVLEEQRTYQEELKEGGEALLKLFDSSNLCRTQEQRIEELKQQEEEKRLQAANDFNIDEYRATQERLRQERIEAARLLVEKLKPGPRALQCAKLQSEVLRAVKVQRQLQHEFEAATRAQTEYDRHYYAEQTLNGIKEAQTAHAERQQQAKQYKLQLLQAMAERQKIKAEERKQQLKKENSKCADNERANAQHLKKERETKERKRKELRQNALEAMYMAEQRKQRLGMLEEVEQRKCDIYNVAKLKLDTLISCQAQLRAAKRIENNEALAKAIAPRLHYSATQDEQRRERELQRMRQAFSAEERARHEKLKAAKEARIATQQQEQTAAKEAKMQAEAQKLHDTEMRLQNANITRTFKQNERAQFFNNVKQLRTMLDEQVTIKEAEAKKPDVDYNKQAELESLKHDKFFFDYAVQLMTKAKADNCPLQPFVSTVEQYKRDQRIGAENKIPRHLISKLTIGLRTLGDSRAEAKRAAAVAATTSTNNDETEEQLNMKQILERCRKIVELAGNED